MNFQTWLQNAIERKKADPAALVERERRRLAAKADRLPVLAEFFGVDPCDIWPVEPAKEQA